MNSKKFHVLTQEEHHKICMVVGENTLKFFLNELLKEVKKTKKVNEINFPSFYEIYSDTAINLQVNLVKNLCETHEATCKNKVDFNEVVKDWTKSFLNGCRDVAHQFPELIGKTN